MCGIAGIIDLAGQRGFRGRTDDDDPRTPLGGKGVRDGGEPVRVPPLRGTVRRARIDRHDRRARLDPEGREAGSLT